jgi:hypothetical protein
MEYRASRAQKANGLGDIAAVHEKLQSCGHLQINRGTILREMRISLLKAAPSKCLDIRKCCGFLYVAGLHGICEVRHR